MIWTRSLTFHDLFFAVTYKSRPRLKGWLNRFCPCNTTTFFWSCYFIIQTRIAISFLSLHFDALSSAPHRFIAPRNFIPTVTFLSFTKRGRFTFIKQYQNLIILSTFIHVSLYSLCYYPVLKFYFTKILFYKIIIILFYNK